MCAGFVINFEDTHTALESLNSLDLYLGSLKDSIKDDDAFVMVTVDHDRREISIDQNTPLVWRNDKVRSEYAETFPTAMNCPTRAELNDNGGRINGRKERYQLLSGGANVWIQDKSGEIKMATLRRDEGAPVAAGYLTGPNGLCAEDINLTILKETNEELGLIITDEHGAHTMPIFKNKDGEQGASEQVISGKLQKTEGIMDGNVNTATVIIPEADAGPGYTIIGKARSGDHQNLASLSDFICEDSFGALCCRRNIVLEVDSFDQVTLFDAEPFGRDTALKTVDELRNDLALDDIVQYLDSLKADAPDIQSSQTPGL